MNNQETNKIIKGYQKIINKNKLMIIFLPLIWFWLGYIYGLRGSLMFGFIVWDLILILFIEHELRWRKIK